MVKICWLLFFPLLLMGGEFTASVSRNPTLAGEGVSLILTLKNAEAKEKPVYEVLKKDFTVHGEQVSHHQSIVNGTASKSISWQVTLVPLREGDIVVPSISVKTKEGNLETSPLTLHVVKGSMSENTVQVSAAVNKQDPYKNESFVYTVMLFSKYDLANVMMDKPEVENMIIEQINTPLFEKRVVEGVLQNVVEVVYIATPLKTGEMEIPSLTIQGEVLSRQRNFFSMAMHKPFVIKTDSFPLNVKAVKEGIVASSLSITESSSDLPIKIGDPLTRTFEIRGEGILANDLPNLKLSEEDFKVYADKPEMVDNVKKGKLYSYKKEIYTLIAKEAGVFTLPEISVAWWDVENKKKAVIVIPAKTIEVKPLKEIAVETPPHQQSAPYFYILIGMASSFLIMGLFKIKSIKTKGRKKKDHFPDINPT